MDQLTSAAGVAGHALRIDCHDLGIEPVRLPVDVEVVVVHSGVPRTLAGSAYADRRRECEAAEAHIGPLRLARPGDERSIADPVLRRRARHVLTENQRVRDTVAALRADDVGTLGELMAASHASLRDDFAVSVPEVDALVDRLVATDGVHGARMTGGGFGGCVVALTRPGAALRGVAGAGLGGRPRAQPGGLRAAIRSCSRARAEGVRTPHQNRSWPSTSTVGATCSSSATCRSRKGYGSDGREDDVGPPRPHLVELDLRVPLGRVGAHVLDAERGQHGGPVGRRTDRHPRAAPDRHEGTEPERREVRRRGLFGRRRRRPRAASAPSAGADVGHRPG